MPTTDGIYPSMLDYPRHEHVCACCGEPLPVYCLAETEPTICDECEELSDDEGEM